MATHSSEDPPPGPTSSLGAAVDCEVRRDSYSRQLYASDASAYQVTPLAVAFPETKADVAAVVDHCAAKEVPVLPRGAGTSLAGQAVNEAVVLDFTHHMDEVVDVDPDARTATLQPGVVLGELETTLEPHGLTFGPDPAWGDKSTIGGAVGNNSSGAHSLAYGMTDATVESCEVVLADGTVTRLGPVDLETLADRADPDGDLEERLCAFTKRVVDEEAGLVREAFPSIERNVSGYGLDRLVAEAHGEPLPGGEQPAGGSVNLARLLVGSEGTLGVVTEVTVSLERRPAATAACMLCYPDRTAAMADVEAILEHEPAAIEALDDVLLDLARETVEFGPLVETLPAETGATLLVESFGESDADARAAIEEVLADRLGDRAHDALEAYTPEDRTDLWHLRKAGLPILLSRTTDEKHISFVEDTAVPPERLPEFVERFEAILEAHDTTASFYAHAGPGVLHVRPLVNTRTEAGLEQLHDIAAAASDLVVDLGGSISGEHGDGRARTQWIEAQYGPAVLELFRELKSALDPDWILNPGPICGDVDLRENLRFDPDYAVESTVDPTLAWENDNGLQGMVELCHGCGGCRGSQAVVGGVMCPTYRATGEEITSTRGRANMLRAAMSGELGAETVHSEQFLEEVLDLCIGCKGCLVDCPSGVDLATLKVELTHEYRQQHGSNLRDRLFRDVDRLTRLGSRLAPLSNLAPRVPGARLLLERTLGLARDRPLPTFASESFVSWFDDRGPAVPQAGADHRVVVLPDPQIQYCDPAIGRAAVRTLEAAGVHVVVPTDATDVTHAGARLGRLEDSGRPAYSLGFLEDARETATTLVEALAPLVAEGWDVVALEPSDAAMIGMDYAHLIPGRRSDRVGQATFGPCEYLDVYGLDERLECDTVTPVTFHGHCHQKAAGTDHHPVRVLRRVGYQVDALDSGCCGMAGTFGFEAEHAELSDAIAEILYDQVRASPGALPVTPGGSCRTQLSGMPESAGRPPTPIELVDRARL